MYHMNHTAFRSTLKACVPTGSPPEPDGLLPGGGAAVVQRGVRGPDHGGGGPGLPGHDGRRPPHAAGLLPGGGAADEGPDGTTRPQGLYVCLYPPPWCLGPACCHSYLVWQQARWEPLCRYFWWWLSAPILQWLRVQLKHIHNAYKP